MVGLIGAKITWLAGKEKGTGKVGLPRLSGNEPTQGRSGAWASDVIELSGLLTGETDW
jgi:hypothetical protein